MTDSIDQMLSVTVKLGEKTLPTFRRLTKKNGGKILELTDTEATCLIPFKGTKTFGYRISDVVYRILSANEIEVNRVKLLTNISESIFNDEYTQDVSGSYEGMFIVEAKSAVFLRDIEEKYSVEFVPYAEHKDYWIIHTPSIDDRIKFTKLICALKNDLQDSVRDMHLGFCYFDSM